MIRVRLSRRARRWTISIAVLVVVALGAGFALFRIADSRTFQFFGGLTARVETSERVIALTFDDGPDPAGVRPVLDALAARQVKATFFLVGRELLAVPGDLGDVVLLDLYLPELDGIDVLRQLRLRPAAPKVLMLTTIGRPAEIRRALAAGARGFVLKDSTGGELAAAVRADQEGVLAMSPAVAAVLSARVRKGSLSANGMC